MHWRSWIIEFPFYQFIVTCLTTDGGNFRTKLIISWHRQSRRTPLVVLVSRLWRVKLRKVWAATRSVRNLSNVTEVQCVHKFSTLLLFKISESFSGNSKFVKFSFTRLLWFLTYILVHSLSIRTSTNYKYFNKLDSHKARWNSNGK